MVSKKFRYPSLPLSLSQKKKKTQKKTREKKAKGANTRKNTVQSTAWTKESTDSLILSGDEEEEENVEVVSIHCC